jgi:hypothetical protein
MSGSLGGLRLAPSARAGPGQADLMCKSATMHPAALRQSRPAASGRIHAVFRRSIMVRFRHMPHVTLVTCKHNVKRLGIFSVSREAMGSMPRPASEPRAVSQRSLLRDAAVLRVISAKRRLSPKLQKETFGVPQPERRTCMEISVRDERYPLDRLTSPGNDPCIGPAIGMQFPSTRVQIGLSPRGIILFGCMIFAFFAEIDCPPGRLDFLSFGFPRTERRLRMAAAVRSRCAPTALQDRPRMISN